MAGGFVVQVQFNQNQLRSVDRFLGTYQGVELNKRIDVGLLYALKPVVAKLKTAEQVSGIHNRSGLHLKSIKQRKSRKRYGEATARTVGPSDYKRFWLIEGHVTRDGHTRARAFPYVDHVIASSEDDVLRQVGDFVWATRP